MFPKADSAAGSVCPGLKLISVIINICWQWCVHRSLTTRLRRKEEKKERIKGERKEGRTQKREGGKKKEEESPDL